MTQSGHFISALFFFSFVCFSHTLSTRADAAAPRVLAEDKLPNDTRLKPLKDYDGYFPFRPSQSPEAWQQRAAAVRMRINVATGLWPKPVRTPIKAVVHGKIDQGDYTVEKVYFQSFPGLYVTGNLYRPKGKKGKVPGVLCPHGHWSQGRFYRTGDSKIKRQLTDGAEKFPNSGRYPLQARCVQLARMGCVVFHYDMLGYADNVPISSQVIHRFSKQTDIRNQPNRWGLFSAQAELRLQSALGLQSYNSARALDWLSSLPEVDKKRLAMTGASGGGTQTFILSATDPRLAVSFPAVMVSTAMQGGCTCENATYLRIGTGNVEFAALFAPKPLGMSFANDWTKEMPKLGMPYLKQHFKMLGKPQNVVGKHFDYPHNYNHVSRALMYQWFNRHLALGNKKIVERDFKPLSPKDLTVWNDEHPKPEMSFAKEASLLKKMDHASNQQIAKLAPKDQKSLKEYRRVMQGALDVMVGRSFPAAVDVEHVDIDHADKDGYQLIRSLVRNTKHQEELPALFLFPKKWNKSVVIWVDPQGKAGLYGKAGKLRPAVLTLVKQGTAVVGFDLLYQGDFLKDGKARTQTRRVKNSRQFAGYTLGFNHPLFAQRVHDVMTMIAFVKHFKLEPEKIHLVGVKGAAHWVAAAGAMSGSAVDKIAIDTAGFRFAKVANIRAQNFWPGAVKYGDMPMLLAMCTPHKLWLAGEKKLPTVTAMAYRSAGRENHLARYQGSAEDQLAAMVKWILAND